MGYFYTYYGNGFNCDNIEAATYDATWFKLREVTLGYDLPATFTERMGLHRARLSLVGRNLLLFTDVPTIDPETYSIRNDCSCRASRVPRSSPPARSVSP
ncbi:hypothetical protein [Lewinella sp. IMCC34183]|uniref:hypothetical protein n=1 Tax=Lewinella sp. IMCC34183 TaxID=2248762 RepID=UPI0018E57B08|nr:hypothetical protein [Lewinella sp. IMCC34183]